MKSAKPAAADASSSRRSQPVRNTRVNPPRSSIHAGRPGAVTQPPPSRPAGNQPIDIFPAITHFADSITALPKELVRHFTLLKEVDAKIFTPQDQLFKLVSAATNSSLPDSRLNNDASSTIAPTSAPMSTQGSSTGYAGDQSIQPPSVADLAATSSSTVFDPSNIPRRQLFRQTAFKIQELLTSLEEKNHVISTANEALQRQLARVEDVWPHLENEFSDEAKWGSTTHWAYPENRHGQAHPERLRRDGAAAISAAARALADEAAARSDARKQAVQAKRNMKNGHQDSDMDEIDGRATKKTQKGRRAADADSVGLGISSSANPQKRRKTEKALNGGTAMERSVSAATSKAKMGSPRGTPGPEPKKRKALPNASGQTRKKYVLNSSHCAQKCNKTNLVVLIGTDCMRKRPQLPHRRYWESTQNPRAVLHRFPQAHHDQRPPEPDRIPFNPLTTLQRQRLQRLQLHQKSMATALRPQMMLSLSMALLATLRLRTTVPR